MGACVVVAQLFSVNTNVKFPLYLRKAGLASRNIVTPSKKQSKLCRFLPFLFILFVKPIRSLYWSNVHRQDHRSGCLLKHFILIIRYSLSGIVFRSMPASKPLRTSRNGQLSCDTKFYSQGQPKQPHTKPVPGSRSVESPPAFSIVPKTGSLEQATILACFHAASGNIIIRGRSGLLQGERLMLGIKSHSSCSLANEMYKTHTK